MAARDLPVEMMILHLGRPQSEIIGLQAVPGRLVKILRFPGEPLIAMKHRALWLVQGGGPLLVYPMFRD